MSAEKEYRVGEVFRKEGETYLCVIDDSDGDVACKRCEIKHLCWDGMECKAEDRSDNTGVHFVRVTEPKAGMMFRASDGKLYELKCGKDEKCVCHSSDTDLTCRDLDDEAFEKTYYDDDLFWCPVEEKQEEGKEVIDYSKIDLRKVYMKRHLELAVVAVENDTVKFKVEDQFYGGDEFSQQENKSEFKSKYGIVINLSDKLAWDGYNEVLTIRRFWQISSVYETAQCNVHNFADIMEAINEYNETDGKGYEKQWPKGGDKYYYVGPFGEIIERIYLDDIFEEPRKTFGNFFRTREEAEAALERVKKALKGIDENKLLREVLEEAVAMYGKPGGPWNVPGDAGGWISKARKALEVGNE